MPQEIERKFLVAFLPNLENYFYEEIEQGYLCLGDKEEVRLRRLERDLTYSYTLTAKKGSGLVRGEYEISLDKLQFDKLWPMTEGRRIYKQRYCDPSQPDITVDIYMGPLTNLMIVEVEFLSEEEAILFQPYDWMGKEVTYDDNYKNRSLAVKQTIPSCYKY